MEADFRASLGKESSTYKRINPFGVTKSDDFSDEEISAYWIEPGELSAEQLLAPTRRMPMHVLGGKGSGKTHLLRRLSLAVQERWTATNNLESPNQKLSFLGVYIRCDGLNAHRFSGKSQSEETWLALFQYFLDLWLTHALLTQVHRLGHSDPVVTDIADSKLSSAVWSLFDEVPNDSPSSLGELLEKLRLFLREIDIALNNLPLTGKLELRIRVAPSRLIFEVPQHLSRLLPRLSDVIVLYLLDEMENLSEVQQRYVNTLVRHRRGNCTFRLGARLYGIKTNATLDGETNRNGSEFDVLELDGFWRQKATYREFCAAICLKRLEALGHLNVTGWNGERLRQCFDEPSSQDFYQKFSMDLIGHLRSAERPYNKRLKSQLAGDARGNSVDIALLFKQEFPVLEKLNLYLFYKAWSKDEVLQKSAEQISQACAEFVESGGTGVSDYKTAYQHFALDMLAQLQRETRNRVKYVGFDTFIAMSAGLPRNLLIILKDVFDWSTFNGENPFSGKPISMESQERAVLEATTWFFDDARPKHLSEQVQRGVERLATLFREIRYSNKPSECSLSTFSCPAEGIDASASSLLRLAVDWSLLIKHKKGQKDRNSSRVDEKYQVSPMLAPRWELPLARRGALALRAPEINAIFGENLEEQWEEFRKLRVTRMNVPFKSISETEQVSRTEQREPRPRTLFEDDL